MVHEENGPEWLGLSGTTEPVLEVPDSTARAVPSGSALESDAEEELRASMLLKDEFGDSWRVSAICP